MSTLKAGMEPHHLSVRLPGGMKILLPICSIKVLLHTVIKNGSTALMVAAERSHLETVKVLMKQGADVQARSNRGWTPLMVAVAGGHTEITRLFLDEGAKWDVKSKAGWTALKVAFKLGKKEVVLQLMEAGANK